MRNFNTDMDIEFTKIYTPTALYKALPFGLESLSRYLCHKDYIAEREDIPNYIILYTTQGSGVLTYLGTDYHVSAGELFFIDCMNYHLYKTEGSQWEYCYMIIYGDCIRPYYDLMFRDGFYIIDNFNETHVMKFINDIFYIDDNFPTQFELIASQKIGDFLTQLVLMNNETSPLFSKVSDYITENYQKKISVDELAELVNMSKYHFIRKFKQVYAETPYEFVNRFRVNQAKMLLSTTKLSVDEISEQTGFANTNTFIRMFKKLTDITPNKYRSTVTT